MPYIPLDGTKRDTNLVWSIMLFPNDQELRSHYLRVLQLGDQLSQTDDSVTLTVTAGELRSLMHGPSWTEVLSLAAEAVKGGTIAGDILATIYLMNAFKGQHGAFHAPSFGKAVHVIQKFASGRRFGNGDPLPISEATIRKKWVEFESVAHLWAATRLNLDYPFCPDKAWLHSIDSCREMMAVAAGMLRFGANHIPERTKPPKPVLSLQDAWLIPEDVGSKTLKSDHIPDQLLEYLSSYKAG